MEEIIRNREPLWHVELAVIVAIVLQLLLSEQVSAGPKYAIAGLELALLIGLHFSEPTKHAVAAKLRRMTALTLTGIVTLANIISLALVCSALVDTTTLTDGKHLLVSALAIYATNIIIFGLWYWQLDGGGGGRGTHKPPADFLFPQMTASTRATESPNWRPTFFDYLFVSITNGTAFSPTDTLPLTHRAKLLMSIQALVALLTVALVAARAINILA